MINIIKGDKINIDFEKLFEELDKNANSKLNPHKLKGIIGPLNQILDQQMEEADIGNLSLNLMDNKHLRQRENLKKSSEKNPQTLKIQIGTDGIILLSKNKYIFVPISNKKFQKEITIDYPQYDYMTGNLKQNLYTYNNSKGKIIILGKNSDSYNCCIFEDLPKTYNKELFTLIQQFELGDKIYSFGTVVIEKIANNYGLVEEFNKNVK